MEEVEFIKENRQSAWEGTTAGREDLSTRQGFINRSNELPARHEFINRGNRFHAWDGF